MRIPFPGRGAGFVVSVGLAVAVCGPDGDGRVACLYTDQECIEEARLRGAEVVLVDAEGNPVDRSGAGVQDSSAATIPGEGSIWWMDEGDARVEGTIGFFGRGEEKVAVQLVSEDAVNLLIVMPEEGKSEREAEDAILVFGRGPTCDMVGSDPPFHVRLAASEGPWLAGRYAGTIACPDSLRVVSGAFRVETGEEG